MNEYEVVRLCQNCRARKIEDTVNVNVTVKTIIDKIKTNKCPFSTQNNPNKYADNCARFLRRRLNKK